MAITQQWLKNNYLYNPETGVFIKKSNGKIIGGLQQNGYVRIVLKGKEYKIHRLAWLYEYGYMPKEIDHINQNRSDNRLANLREVSRLENMKNKQKYKTNKSGQAGVYWNKKNQKWQCTISVNKKKIHLGLFADFSDAVDVRKKAEITHCFHINHGKVL